MEEKKKKKVLEKFELNPIPHQVTWTAFAPIFLSLYFISLSLSLSGSVEMETKEEK